MTSINEQLLEYCLSNETKQIPSLIVRGADPNFRHGPNGHTVLHMACEKGFLEVVQAIATRGGFPNFTDNRGWSALHYAAAAGQTEVVRYLLVREVDSLIRENTGRTALELAEEMGHQEVVQILKEAESSLQEKLEKEQRIIEEEQRRIHQLKQMVIEKEKRRSMIALSGTSPPLQKGSHLGSKEDLFKPESPQKEPERKNKHRSFGEELPSVGEGSEVSHESSPIGISAGEGSGTPSPVHTPLEEKASDKKGSRFSFLMKASSMLKDISSSTSLKSKRGSGNLDKGDKWIDFLAEEHK